MHYGFNNKNFAHFIHGQEVKSTKPERDLVAIFSYNLKWKIGSFHVSAKKIKQWDTIIIKSFAHLYFKLLR